MPWRVSLRMFLTFPDQQIQERNKWTLGCSCFGFLLFTSTNRECMTTKRAPNDFCRHYTSYVTFSCSEHTLIVAHHIAWLKVLVRVIRIVIHVCDLIVCLLSLCLTLFPSVCFSYFFFFYQNLDLCLFLFHVDVIEARALRPMMTILTI